MGHTFIKRPYRTVNGLLVLTAFFLLGYLVWDTMNTKPYTFKSIVLPPGKAGKEQKKQKTAELYPHTYYLSRVTKRNIFTPYREYVEPEKKEEPEIPRIPISQLVQGIRVVGFSYGDNIVMIHSSDTGKTEFLKVGDVINDVTIKKILEDGILVTNGVEELKLE